MTPLDPELERQIDAAIDGPAPPRPTHCHYCKKAFAPEEQITFGRCCQCFVKECNDPDNDYYDYDDGERERCDRCGGEGFVEYVEAPETWGEDCPSEMNHLVVCPDCNGRGDA